MTCHLDFPRGLENLSLITNKSNNSTQQRYTGEIAKQILFIFINICKQSISKGLYIFKFFKDFTIYNIFHSNSN